MITILDGGMGGELIRRQATSRNELWSAQALIDDPNAVLQVHRDYLAAGADMIITNSYATIPSYLSKLGMEDRFQELTELAGHIARQAADETDREVLVAGSLPPLDESYRPDLSPPDQQARPIYRSLARSLDPFVDLFLCETMSCIRESVNAATAAREIADPGKPVYVSWTLAEGAGEGLRSGETIQAAVDSMTDLNVNAYLFNCTSPEAISSGLAEIRALTDQPFGAYPNRLSIPAGWTLDNDVPTGFRVDLDVASFVDYAGRWVEQGASIIGGCCGVGPEYIEALAESLAQ